VVTLQFAKLPYVGSIPTRTSSFRRLHLPGWRNGIRARLKIVSRKGYGFESHPGHIKYLVSWLCGIEISDNLLSIPSIAQLVEQSPLKRKVVGSNPTGWTRCTSGGMVYALVLGTSGAILGGSSPLSCTTTKATCYLTNVKYV